MRSHCRRASIMLTQILEQVLNGPARGRLLPADRARPVADLFAGGLVNLAHGAFYALGAYFAVIVAEQLGLGFARFGFFTDRRCPDRVGDRAIPVSPLLSARILPSACC